MNVAASCAGGWLAASSRSGRGLVPDELHAKRPDLQARIGSARWALVEAAWSAVLQPGPLRAFYQRVRDRRGHRKAIVGRQSESRRDRTSRLAAT